MLSIHCRRASSKPPDDFLANATIETYSNFFKLQIHPPLRFQLIITEKIG
jgi:hypothetical protein